MIFLVVSVANSSSKQHFKGKVRKNARAKALCRNCPGVFSILEKTLAEKLVVDFFRRFFQIRKSAPAVPAKYFCPGVFSRHANFSAKDNPCIYIVLLYKNPKISFILKRSFLPWNPFNAKGPFFNYEAQFPFIS